MQQKVAAVRFRQHELKGIPSSISSVRKKNATKNSSKLHLNKISQIEENKFLEFIVRSLRLMYVD